MTGNEQDAEDVVQESFIKAYRHLGHFQTRANFGTWLYRIVANCAVDMIRARQSRRTHTPGEPFERATSAWASDLPGPERLAESREVQRRITAALALLSPLERAAFALRHYEGRTIEEVSGMLGLGTSAAKQAIFRAVRKLRMELQELRIET
jgi:RNA polymerase sigma-70 factor (ECF subfamily)